MNLRKTAALLAAAGLTAGLVGAGVSASWTDSATAAGTFTVGTLHCAVSSSDPSAVVSGNSVTITAPPILSSAAGNYLTSMTVTNTGSIAEVVHWTEATSGTLPANRWQPTGPMGYAQGAGGDLLSTDLTLTGGASHTYANGIGFMWANAGGSGVQLGNADEGLTATVTYTANCGEKPALVSGSISFVGAADAAFPTFTAKKASSVACPAGSPAAGFVPWVSTNANQWCGNNTFPVSATLASWPSSGSFTVTASAGSATVTYTGTQTSPYFAFTGLTNTSSATGYVTAGSNNVVQVAPPNSIALPAVQAGDLVISYGLAGNVSTVPTAPGTWTQVGSGNSGYSYGYTDVAYHFAAAGDTSVVFPAVTQHGMVAVYRGVASIGASSVSNPGNNQNWGCGPLTLAQPNGSSWVACLGGDGTGTFNVAAAYAPAVWGTTLRSSGFSDVLSGLSDTNHGVTSWTPPTYASGDYGHGGANWGLELLSK